ncbi:MAG: M23 family metallopeptidase [Magnetococcales bacterium]|nr:M23 family metallopeptidase [Magnetococcales bacterium]
MRNLLAMPLRTLLAALLLGVLPLSAIASELSVTGQLQPGGAILLKVTGFPKGATMKGSLEGQTFPVTAAGLALVALDMEAHKEKARLDVEIQAPDGSPPERLTHTFAVAPRGYREEHLNLPEEKVELNAEDLQQADREKALINQTFERRGGEPGYLLGFQIPAEGRLTGIFGSRRILNGKARNPHNGIDIAAAKGTPVVALAPGVVALVGEDFLFTGRTLILDHGDGVFSLYSHLDSILVTPNTWVPLNTIIGTVGQSGRATGPHLHLGVRVREARVDPLALPGLQGKLPRP